MFPKTLQGPDVKDASDSRWLLLRRVVDSATFGRSPRLRDFLLYIGRKTIENRLEDIREQTIGEQVFDRRPDYNPGEDNIVRVEARLLRKRLEQFFATEGADEALVITIPKGAYVPHFGPRESVAEALPTAHEVPHPAEAPVEVPIAVDLKPARRRLAVHPLLFAVLVGLAISSCVASVVFALRLRGQEVGSRDTRNALWTALFNDRLTTNIICADSGWVLRQDILGHDLRLSDYLSMNWNRPLPVRSASDERALQILAFKQYTSLGDVHMVERLLLLNRIAWRRAALKSARQAQLIDFKGKNAILLGSFRAVPWDELFSPQLNFWVGYDYSLGVPTVTNRVPRAGEQAVYRNGMEGDGPGYDYSVVAFLPNIDHTGHVLVIAGTTMQGMEAAGDYVTDPERGSALLKTLGAGQEKQPPYFEVLLSTGTMGGGPLRTKLIAYRVLKAGE